MKNGEGNTLSGCLFVNGMHIILFAQPEYQDNCRTFELNLLIFFRRA